jgi:hypothetical protein
MCWRTFQHEFDLRVAEDGWWWVIETARQYDPAVHNGITRGQSRSLADAQYRVSTAWKLLQQLRILQFSNTN